MAEHTDKKQLTQRLSKIRGQVEGITKLIHEDRDCVDIITQCKAIRGALLNLERLILKEHISHCIADALQNPSGNNQKLINELIDLYKYHA